MFDVEIILINYHSHYHNYLHSCTAILVMSICMLHLSPIFMLMLCCLVNTHVSGYSVCLCFRQASELAIQQFLVFLLAGLKL